MTIRKGGLNYSPFFHLVEYWYFLLYILVFLTIYFVIKFVGMVYVFYVMDHIS